MKELHEEERTTTPAKDVSELSVEELVKQLESMAYPLEDDEKSAESDNKKDTDGEFSWFFLNICSVRCSITLNFEKYFKFRRTFPFG